MKRVFVFLAFLCAGLSPALAQSLVSSIEIDKKIQPGLQLELANNTDVAEGTLLQKLKETGYTPETTGTMFWKKNTKDGFYVFNGVSLPDLNNQKLDLYFKIDRKSKREKQQSVMYMLVSKGYDNFVSGESDSTTFAAATLFLNSFVSGNAAYSLQQEVEAQEKTLTVTQKKLSSLQDDDRSLRKKIEQLNADLVNNQSQIEVQTREVANQQTILQTLKSKVIN